MSPEQIESGFRHLATKEELALLRADIHQDFGEFGTRVLKEFGDFKADLLKTIWITQLSTIGIILVGLLLHFRV
jgi:hypothetical protein